MTVEAAAVAAEHKFFLVALEEILCESRVPGEGVIAGVRGHIGEEVGVISEKFICDAAAFDWAGGVGILVGKVSADVGPKGVGMADEPGLRVGL